MTDFEVVYRIDAVEQGSPREAAQWLADNLPAWAARGVYEVRPTGGGDGLQIDLSGELDDVPLPAGVGVGQQVTDVTGLPAGTVIVDFTYSKPRVLEKWPNGCWFGIGHTAGARDYELNGFTWTILLAP